MDFEIPLPSGDPETDSLVERRWLGNVLSFSFPTAAAQFTGYADGEPFDNFESLNAVQQAAARAILASISTFTNLTFVEATGADAANAVLRFGMTDDTPTAHAYLPSSADTGGDSWYRNTGGDYDDPRMGNYAWLTFMHEIGHALGFGHPHQSTPAMDANRDWMPYTVMSYRSGIGTPLNTGYTNEDWGFAQTYMMEDIAALQFLYGANFNYNSSDTVYSWSPTTGEMFINGVGQGAPGENRVFMTIWDGGGTDTYDFSNYTDAASVPFLTINLDPGQWTQLPANQKPIIPAVSSPGNIANALLYNNDPRSLIENVIGSPRTDFINGNMAANHLFGGAGTDYIYGGGGDDILEGGDHFDILYGGDGNDRLYSGGGSYQSTADILYGEAGDDFLYAGPDGADLRGGDGNDRLEGGVGARDDYLEGGAGNDILIGYGGDGWYGDSLNGGPGDDVYYYDNDRITEAAGEGNDRIIVNVSYSLTANVEIETMETGDVAGTNPINLAGNGFANALNGNAARNFLFGNGGNDVITGNLGGDEISGGAGADVFRYVSAEDSTAAQFDWLRDFEHGTDLIDLREIPITSFSFNFEAANSQTWVTLGTSSGATMLILVAGQTVLSDLLLSEIPEVSLTGTGDDDTIHGNSSDNVLDGKAGNDLLDGKAGNDLLIGGLGADEMSGGTGIDVFHYGVAAESTAALYDWLRDFEHGTDLIDMREISITSYSFNFEAANSQTWVTLGTASGATMLILVSGQAVASDFLLGEIPGQTLTGTEGDDTLDGTVGGDTLIGGAGNDTLIGRGGNDVFFVDAGDWVYEAAGDGNDRVVASANYALGAGQFVEMLETLTYTGTGAINLTGNDLANTIFGNNGPNTLFGQGGADTIHGFAGNDYLFGGTGFDNMYGGAGDDAYYIASADGDRIWEFAGEGYDTVSTEVDYELPDTAFVERLEAGTLSATTALYLGGSNQDNLLIGNAGNNTLRGFGGVDTLHGLDGNDVLIGDSGADVMYGGAGNDTYYVDSSDDRVFENPGEGTADRVAAQASFTLPSEAEVEVLEAVNLNGTAVGELGGSDTANTITGDVNDNVLRGYGGDDVLNGYLGRDTLIGGVGNDIMIGGVGDDVYFVDAAGDVVNELAGNGNDRVVTSVSYTLGAGAEIETLETTSLGGTGAIDLTGNSSANTLVGNSGVNVLDGKAGNDILNGRAGADAFVFTTTLGADNIDLITDFAPGSDKIRLDDAVFTGLATGALAAGVFVTGSAAQDGDDRIVYNSATGALYFDGDGSGAGAAVQFATLSGAPALTAADFVVI